MRQVEGTRAWVTKGLLLLLFEEELPLSPRGEESLREEEKEEEEEEEESLSGVRGPLASLAPKPSSGSRTSRPAGMDRSPTFPQRQSAMCESTCHSG